MAISISSRKLLTLIFLVGFVDLSLQILAGRMLTPYFGSSVYTWGSVIGVFMIILALGYYIGGHVSKKRFSHLVPLFLLSSVFFICVTVFSGQLVLEFIRELGISSQYAAIPSVLILFGPPSFLLALLTPLAVELLGTKRKGEASGSIFATGTIGSIFGAFGATFLLIPSFALETSFFILAGILLMSFFLLPSFRKNSVLFFIICVFVILSAIIVNTTQTADAELVYKTQTPYQQLEVRDEDGIRKLYLDGQTQSGMRLDAPYQHVYLYTRFFELPFLLKDEIIDVLFIGGGGFTGPRTFAARGMNVDVVELDPGVAKAAKEYFLIDDDMMNIVVDDGRYFLSGTDKQYDLIILDAYRKDRIPFHMATTEFYELIESRLVNDGIFLSNLIAYRDGEDSLFYRTMYYTLKETFPNTFAFETRKPNVLQNIELLAIKTNSSIGVEYFDTLSTMRHPYGYNIAKELSQQITAISNDDVVLLRDNKAPLDSLTSSIADAEFALS